MKTTWWMGERAPFTAIGLRTGGVPTVATTSPGSAEPRAATATATSAAAESALHTLRCTRARYWPSSGADVDPGRERRGPAIGCVRMRAPGGLVEVQVGAEKHQWPQDDR